jgi:hypothetical protein
LRWAEAVSDGIALGNDRLYVDRQRSAANGKLGKGSRAVDLERLKWAESRPKAVVSGTTGIGAITDASLRARNGHRRQTQALIYAPTKNPEGRIPVVQR